MKKLTTFTLASVFAGSLMASMAFAAPQPGANGQSPMGLKKHWRLPMNKVSFILTDKQWVTTNTALVTVEVNSTLDKQSASSSQQPVAQLANLNKLSQGEWHLTQINQTQNSSGLEQVTMVAQARLPQSGLSDIRAKAKAMSKPGLKYTVNNIGYTPSLAEIEAVQATLRQEIYQEAKAELARLNAVYPDEQFYLHKIKFGNGMGSDPQPRMLVAAKMAQPMGGSAVSQQLVLSAKVVLASKAKK